MLLGVGLEDLQRVELRLDLDLHLLGELATNYCEFWGGLDAKADSARVELDDRNGDVGADLNPLARFSREH